MPTSGRRWPLGDEVGTLEIHNGRHVVVLSRRLVALDIGGGGVFQKLLDQAARFLLQPDQCRPPVADSDQFAVPV